MNITITDRAFQEAQKIRLATEGLDAFGLRLSIRGGGCSGLAYNLGFDLPTERDEVFLEKEGLKFFVDYKSALYLDGAELDFTDGLQGRGFIFNNPNAKRTCGCGNSFGA